MHAFNKITDILQLEPTHSLTSEDKHWLGGGGGVGGFTSRCSPEHQSRRAGLNLNRWRGDVERMGCVNTRTAVFRGGGGGLHFRVTIGNTNNIIPLFSTVAFQKVLI